MMRLRLRTLVASFNTAAAEYAFARLELAASHPRMVTPPVIDRLGVRGWPANSSKPWRNALRQLLAAGEYVKTGANAVARRDKAWTRLTGAFARARMAAAGIESLRVAGARAERKRRA